MNALVTSAQQHPVAQVSAKLEAWTQAAHGAYAPNTEAAWQADSRAFAAWCVAQGHNPLPAPPETVAAYVTACAEQFAVATVRRYLATIAAVHRAAGLADPTKDETVRLAVKRMARAKGSRQKQAVGLTWEDLRVALRHLDDSPRDLRDRALVLTGYDLLARRSELAALNREDLRFERDGTGRMLIVQGKTDQEGQGTTGFLSKTTCDALRAWMNAAQAEDGPLFQGMARGPHGQVQDRISDKGVERIIKRIGTLAGLDGVSGHSLRVGAAQDLMANGLDIGMIAQAGRWKTTRMPLRYTEAQAAGTSGMAILAAKQRR